MLRKFEYKGKDVSVSRDGDNFYIGTYLLPQHNTIGHSISEFLDVFMDELSDRIYVYADSDDEFLVLIVDTAAMYMMFSHNGEEIYRIVQSKTHDGCDIYLDSDVISKVDLGSISAFCDDDTCVSLKREIVSVKKFCQMLSELLCKK